MSPFSYFVKSFPELTTLDEMLTFLLLLEDFDSQLLLLVLDLFLGGGVCLLLKFQITLKFERQKVNKTRLTYPEVDF